MPLATILDPRPRPIRGSEVYMLDLIYLAAGAVVLLLFAAYAAGLRRF